MFNTSVADQVPDQVGRYQSSTTFKQDGSDRIYVTVIDTTTGEIVMRARHNPGDYDKDEFTP